MASKYGAMAKNRKQRQDALITDTEKQSEVVENEPVESVDVKQDATPVPKADRPKTGAQRGLPDGWTRFTVTVPIEMAEDMKDLAYTKRLKLKDVVVDAFEQALKGVELMHRPERKR